MELILKNDVENLGFKDDIVQVKNGYGRNFLIPQGHAILATPSAKKVLAENLKQRAFKEQKLVDDANASQYIRALDDAEDNKKEQGVAYRRASWFKNQNIHVDMGRTMTREWDAKKRAWGKWREL